MCGLDQLIQVQLYPYQLIQTTHLRLPALRPVCANCVRPFKPVHFSTLHTKTGRTGLYNLSQTVRTAPLRPILFHFSTEKVDLEWGCNVSQVLGDQG